MLSKNGQACKKCLVLKCGNILEKDALHHYTSGATSLWAQVLTEFGPSWFKLDNFGFIIIFFCGGGGGGGGGGGDHYFYLPMFTVGVNCGQLFGYLFFGLFLVLCGAFFCLFLAKQQHSSNNCF